MYTNEFCNIDYSDSFWCNESMLTYMNTWKTEKTSLKYPFLKKDFYCNLNMKNVYVEHYDHATNAWEEFGIRNLGEYYDLYGQSDTLLLAEVFDIFRSRCIKIYKLYPTHFYSTRVSVVSSIKKQRRVGTN